MQGLYSIDIALQLPQGSKEVHTCVPLHEGSCESGEGQSGMCSVPLQANGGYGNGDSVDFLQDSSCHAVSLVSKMQDSSVCYKDG